MRGTISPVVHGRFLYRYDDRSEEDSHATYLRGHGYDAGAMTWCALTAGLLRLRHPSLLSQIEFNPEAYSLEIWAPERRILTSIAQLIDEAKGDPELFETALRIASDCDFADELGY